MWHELYLCLKTPMTGEFERLVDKKRITGCCAIWAQDGGEMNRVLRCNTIYD